MKFLPFIIPLLTIIVSFFHLKDMYLLGDTPTLSTISAIAVELTSILSFILLVNKQEFVGVRLSTIRTLFITSFSNAKQLLH